MSHHKYAFSTEAVNGDSSPHLQSVNALESLPRTNPIGANGGHTKPVSTSPTTINEDLFLTLAKDVSLSGEEASGHERRQPRIGFSRTRKIKPSPLASIYPRRSPGGISTLWTDSSPLTPDSSHDPRDFGYPSPTSPPSKQTHHVALSSKSALSHNSRPEFCDQTVASKPTASSPTGGNGSISVGVAYQHKSSTEHLTSLQPRKVIYRPSNLGFSSPISPDLDSALQYPAAQSHAESRYQSGADGAESVDSTTAPSTVWDELDELKSRIKRLEITGHRPRIKVASNESGDRPTTGTTTTTATSISPPLPRRAVSTPLKLIDSSVPHPLLRSALRQAKLLVDADIYRSLESCALDALDAAALTGGASGTPLSNTATTSERHARQKLDNLCRSLTELCIALCEHGTKLRSPPLQARHHLFPSSQENVTQHNSPNGGYSPISYLEERRARLQSADQTSAHPSNRVVGARSQSRQTVYSQRDDGLPNRGLDMTRYAWSDHPRPLNRTGNTTSQSKYINAESYGDEDRSPILRQPSRVTSEIHNKIRHRYLLRDPGESSNHTSQHPLPEREGSRPTLTPHASNYSLNSTQTAMSYAPALHSAHSNSTPEAGRSANRQRFERAPQSSSRSLLLSDRIEESRHQRSGLATQLGILLNRANRAADVSRRPGSSRGVGHVIEERSE